MTTNTISAASGNEPSHGTRMHPRPRAAGPSIVRRARGVWEYRRLVRAFAMRDVRVRYKQALLGVAWALLLPVLVILAGLVMKVVMASASGSGAPVPLASLAVKAVCWSFFSGALGFATVSLTANSALVEKVYFPRDVLPMASVGGQLVDLGAGVLLAIGVFVATGVPLTAGVLWALVLVPMLVLLTVAFALVAACGNIFFRDVRYLVQVCLTFGIFFTPIFYEPERLGATGARLIMLNPVAPVLEGLRLSAVDGHSLLRPLVHDGIQVWSPWLLAYSGAWVVGGLLLGAWLYDRFELSFGEYV